MAFLLKEIAIEVLKLLQISATCLFPNVWADIHDTGYKVSSQYLSEIVLILKHRCYQPSSKRYYYKAPPIHLSLLYLKYHVENDKHFKL